VVIDKDIVLERLRGTLGAAISVAKNDPEFLPKVLQTICTELGMDVVASMYLSNKLKKIIQKGASKNVPG
jgi:hypothetical protein